jgi:hypothetical protein
LVLEIDITHESSSKFPIYARWPFPKSGSGMAGGSPAGDFRPRILPVTTEIALRMGVKPLLKRNRRAEFFRPSMV